MAGESFGYLYPDNPKEVEGLGPTPATDYLTPDTTVFQPLPHIMSPIDGVEGLDNVQKGLIEANHKTNLVAIGGYQEGVAKKVLAFYNGVAESSLKLDNLIQF